MPIPKGTRYGGKPKGYKAGHTLDAQAAKQRIIDRVSARVDELVDVLLEKGLVNRDVQAIKELFDRSYGRPSQSMELTGKDGTNLFKVDAEIEKIAAQVALTLKSKKTQ